jgi:hypothetical protein
MLDGARFEALAAVAFVSASPPPVFDQEACRCGCCFGDNLARAGGDDLRATLYNYWQRARPC